MKFQETWKTISLSVSVMTAVGITWLLGFLVTVHIFFSYLFVVLNTTQGKYFLKKFCSMKNLFHLGVFLFVLFIIRNKEARNFAKSEIVNMVETGSSNVRKK